MYMKQVWQGENIQLTADKLIVGTKELKIIDLPEHKDITDLSGNVSPIINRLWKCAVADLTSNLISTPAGRYFAAGGRGKGWSGKMFVRDTSLAGVLGLNIIYPEEMFENQKLMRKRFFECLWMSPRDHVFGWPNLPEKIIPELGLKEYSNKYKFNPPMRCTDDVLWIWCVGDLLKRIDAPVEKWQWFYDTAKRCFNDFYDYLYDIKDGLFYGQSIFMDIGWQGYPERFGRAWPKSYDKTPEAYKLTVELKATSTNCAYVIAMDNLAECADKLNLKSEMLFWSKRAKKLRNAIKAELRNVNGTFSCYKHKDGLLEPRQHALATALAIISKTVQGKSAELAIKNYPVTDFGIPLLYPYFDNDEGYHNKSAWPFVDAFFMRAREIALNIDETPRHLAMLAFSCIGEDTFAETTYMENGPFPGGTPAQLWSAAAFIGRCEQAGLR